MPEWIVNYWVQWLFGVMGTAIIALAGYVWRKLKSMRALELKEIKHNEKRMNAVVDGITSLLFANIKSSAHEFCTQGWISVHDLNDMEDMYIAYHALGGNGTGTKLFEDLKALANRPTRKDNNYE